MTKKNVAALMLAGAMMTVGSGAMAADIVSGNEAKNNDVAKVAVTYTASADIKITLEWASVDPFAYKWDPNTKSWNAENNEQTLTFKAKNDGIVAQNVSITNSTGAGTLDWLTVTQGAKTAENVTPADTADTLATEVATFTLTGKSVNGINGMDVIGKTEELRFTVTIAEATGSQS